MLRFAHRLQPLLSIRTFSAGCARHASSVSSEAAPEVGQRVAASFRESPAATASSIAEALRPTDRLRLLAALSEASRSSADALEDSYVDRLFRMADKQAPLGSLARHALAPCRSYSTVHKRPVPRLSLLVCVRICELVDLMRGQLRRAV